MNNPPEKKKINWGIKSPNKKGKKTKKTALAISSDEEDLPLENYSRVGNGVKDTKKPKVNALNPWEFTAMRC